MSGKINYRFKFKCWDMSDEEKLKQINDAAELIDNLVEKGVLHSAILSVGYKNDEGDDFITTYDISDNKFRGKTIDKILEKYDKR